MSSRCTVRRAGFRPARFRPAAGAAVVALSLALASCSTDAGEPTGPAPAGGTAATAASTPAPGSAATSTVPVPVGGVTFQIMEARSAQEQARGLSVLDSLPADQGMLFRMTRPGVQGIWMKGMRFPIDILWIGAEGMVVHVERSVTPETYPTVFRNPSDRPAIAVIELAAGVAERHGIDVGSPVALPAVTG